MPAKPDPIATPDDALDFMISRTLDAPRVLVFKAWTDPKHLAHWWGPHEFTTQVSELDVRPGGAYRIVMRSQDGMEFPVKGVYREVAAPERLIFTMDCSEHPAAWHEQLNQNLGRKGMANPAGLMLSIVTFEERNGKTLLTTRTRFESTAIRDAMLKLGMTEGWSQSLERLAKCVAKSVAKSKTS